MYTGIILPINAFARYTGFKFPNKARAILIKRSRFVRLTEKIFLALDYATMSKI